MLTHCKTFLLLLFFCQSLLADDWPQFRGKKRDGKSQSTNLLASWRNQKPELVKTLTGAGQGYSSLCVVNGKIYTTGNSKVSQFVVCLDPTKKSGQVNWKTEITSVLPNHAIMGARSTPTFHNDKLYVVASDGTATCLDALSGKILWAKSFQTKFGGRLMSGWGYSESPLVDGNRIILTPGGENALLVALEETTVNDPQRPNAPKVDVQTIWQTQSTSIGTGKNKLGDSLKSGAGYSSVQVARINGIKQYVQFVGGGVIGVDPETGKILWSSSDYANSTANICAPIVSEVDLGSQTEIEKRQELKVDRLVYSSAPRGGLGIYSFSADQPPKLKLKSSFPQAQVHCHHGGMIVHENHLYFGNGENRGFPTCIDLANCNVKWGRTIRGPGRGSASVVFADGNLIFRYQNGVVALIRANPDRYQLLGYFKQAVKSNGRSWAHPVVVDGQLLLREQDSIMVYNLERQ